MLKIKSLELKKTKTGKDYKALEFENGDKVNMWVDHTEYGNAVEGYEFDDDLEKNGKWLNLANKHGEKKNGGQGWASKKKADISEFQANKSQSIDKAQSRNEIMYAKNNASMLIAHHPAYRDLDQDEVISKMARMVTQILADDFQEPF